MKNLLLGLIISVSVFSSCISGGYKIKGKFEPDATGQVYLSKVGLKGIEAIDTTRFVDGTFTFTGKVEISELYIIQFENKQEYVYLFIENKNITVSGNTNNLKDVVIKGSKLNDIYTKFLKNIPNQDDMEKLEQSYYEAQKVDDQKAMDSILDDRKAILEKTKNYFLDNIRANLNNPVGAIITMQSLQFLEMDEFEEFVDLLKQNLPDHPYTHGLSEYFDSYKQQQEIYKKMMEAQLSLEIGKEAPTFILSDINGKEIDLKSFRGKYVLIDFWASWCRPCRNENPNLVKAYKTFGGKKFEIISISVDKSIEEWKKAVNDDGLTWTQLIDVEGDVAEEYAVQSIPNTWLLDKEGNILKKDIRGEELINMLKEIIK